MPEGGAAKPGGKENVDGAGTPARRKRARRIGGTLPVSGGRATRRKEGGEGRIIYYASTPQ